jgi:hypothetical protein
MITIVEIPLNKLRPRAKAGGDEQADKNAANELKRSIEARGLVVPLVVHKNGKDRWDVVKGNRRLWALTELAARDNIKPATMLVPCIVAEADALEAPPPEKAEAPAPKKKVGFPRGKMPLLDWYEAGLHHIAEGEHRCQAATLAKQVLKGHVFDARWRGGPTV